MTKTPEQICRDVKKHAAAIRELLVGIKGDPAEKGSPHSHAFPTDVRDKAYAANCALNRWMTLEFAELHVEIGLGPVTIGGPCKHSKQKGSATEDTEVAHSHGDSESEIL